MNVSKDQQVSGEGRRAKNHKVPVAYAAGLIVCYPAMCKHGVIKCRRPLAAWRTVSRDLLLMGILKGQGHPGGIENDISSVEHTLFP